MNRKFLTVFFTLLLLVGAVTTAATVVFLVKYADPGRDWVFLCLPLILWAAGLLGLLLRKRKKAAEDEPEEDGGIE